MHPKEDENLTFTFVTDGVESAVEQATSAAGKRWVTVVGSVDVAQQLLRAGLVDELRLDVMPVVLRAGRRFFTDADLDRIELEKICVEEVGARTSLRFRVTA